MYSITNLYPEHQSYKNSATIAIAFDILNSADVITDDIIITINSKIVYQNSMFYFGYTGSVIPTPDPYYDTYTVTLYSPYEYPDFVTLTIRVKTEEFNYYFKTKLINNLLITSEVVTAMHKTETFLFLATNAGLDIIDIRTKTNFAYVYRTGGFTGVWCKQQYATTDCIYLSTSDNGVYKILLSDIIRSGDVSDYLTHKFNMYTSPAISSDTVIDLYGSNDNLFLLCPNNVCMVASETTVYTFTFATTIYTGKIRATPEDAVYYLLSDGLHVKYIISSNWASSDYIYNATSTLPLPSNTINDFSITFYTAFTNGNAANTVNIATNTGLICINEAKYAEATGTYKSFGITGQTYNILQSNDIKLVISDVMHEVNYGNLLCGDALGNFYVINNKFNIVQYTYTIDTGNYGDYLNTSSLKAILTI